MKPRVKRELSLFAKLSLPILVSQSSQMMMSTTDVMMAGRVSALDLAAVGVGSSMLWPMFFMLCGPLLGLSPVCAQLFGAKKPTSIGESVRQCAMLSLPLAIVGFLILQNAEPLLLFLKVPAHMASLAATYLAATSWGFFGLVLYTLLRGYSEAVNLTIPISIIALSAALINVPLNYIFIYGKLGLPAMGAVGCGWATAISFSLLGIALLVVTLSSRLYKPYRVYSRWQRPGLTKMLELVRIGVPMSLAIFVEITMFFGAAILASPLGEDVISGHQIAMNFASITFMLPLAVGLGAAVRVGNLVGAGQYHQAAYAGRVALVATAIVSGFNALIMLTIPALIVSLYGADAAVQTIAVALLFYAALFQVPDGIQVCMVGILRGYKITLITMFCMIVCYWIIGLPLGYALMQGNLSLDALGIDGMWIGMIIGVGLVVLMIWTRMHLLLRRTLA